MEAECVRIPAFCKLLYLRTAGVRQVERTRRLVKSLTRRIIARSADKLKAIVIDHANDMAVPAGSHNADKRRFKIRISEIVCGDMPRNMVHADQRNVCGVCEAFCIADAHKQRADQPGRAGYGNCTDVIQTDTGSF